MRPNSQAVKLQTRPIWVCYTVGGDDLNKFLKAFILISNNNQMTTPLSTEVMRHLESKNASQQRKGHMYDQAVAFKEKCISCKVVQGVLVLGLALLNQKRVALFWSNFNLRQKVFNLAMLGGLYVVGVVQFRQAYVYKMGQ